MDAQSNLSYINRPPLGIVGAGRVGGALARRLHQAGWPIVAIYSRSVASAAQLAEAVGAQAVNSINEIAAQSQLILLSVPDSAIQPVCEQVAVRNLSGRAVVHTSGATPIDVLTSAKASGAQIGGLHPILPVARGDRPLPPGGMFGVEAEERPLRDWLSDLVDASSGSALWLPSGIDRIRYHAASTLLSNYLVTLYAEALGLWRGIGIGDHAARAALLGLAQAALDNLEQNDPSAALTGPIIRGDLAVVEAHLHALASDPELAAAYRALGRLTLRLAARRLSPDRIETLYRLLIDKDNETNDANHNL